MAEIETLAKLYLELSNLLPETVVTARELALKKQLGRYGVALMMIAEGCANPDGFARKILNEYGDG